MTRTKELELYVPPRPSTIEVVLRTFTDKVMVYRTSSVIVYITPERRRQRIDIPFPDRRWNDKP